MQCMHSCEVTPTLGIKRMHACYLARAANTNQTLTTIQAEKLGKVQRDETLCELPQTDFALMPSAGVFGLETMTICALVIHHREDTAVTRRVGRVLTFK